MRRAVFLIHHRSSIILSLLLALAAPAHLCADESPAADEPEYSDFEREHWSLVPPAAAPLPQFADPRDRAWVRTPIDAFILEEMRRAGFYPAPEADRPALIRRLSFDLTGLPPTPGEIADYLADRGDEAYERLVDRLLASPRYGERWAQHWLDVVRFAETEGFEYDTHHAHAWRYRDYVIRSLNDDKPYDRFLLEQIAGDELAAAEGLEDELRRALERGERPDPAAPRYDPLVAAAFHRLGPVRRNAGNALVAFSRNEVLTEMTDAVGAAVLGLTIGCARCHDHMFDPVRQRDYYQLQAFLSHTHEHSVPLATPDQHRRWQQANDEVEREVAAVKERLAGALDEEERMLIAQLRAAQLKRPEPLPGIFTVKSDINESEPVRLLRRGDESDPAEPVGMRTLGVLLPEGAPPLPHETPQPKLRLARWLTDPAHPLTARVIVNRLWQHHFGRALVATPNDFGLNGAAPSHERLLDYLAVRLVEDGWRLKAMHRLMVLSSAYRQASRPASPDARQRDPDNRLLSRFNRRRLSADEIRDAMLAVSGRLNLKAGGPSVMLPVEEELVRLLYDPTQWAVTPDPREHDRRSIYLLAKRNLRLPFMEVFDQPDLQTSCSRREESTHAPQALELLNGPLSNDLARALARRVEQEAGGDPTAQIRHAYQLTTGRPPTAEQQQLCQDFLQTEPLSELMLALLNLNGFLYVD